MPDKVQNQPPVGDEFRALESRAVDAEQAPDAAGAAAEGAPAPVLDWGIASAGLVGLFAVYADGWALTHDEQSKLASHLSAALACWFPDVLLDEKWQALAGLGMVAGGVAFARMDPVTRRLPPLRKPKPAENDAPA